ncbi:MAG: hypothetical protein Q9218_007458, partial [Villophora microphyllina]
ALSALASSMIHPGGSAIEACTPRIVNVTDTAGRFCIMDGVIAFVETDEGSLGEMTTNPSKDPPVGATVLGTTTSIGSDIGTAKSPKMPDSGASGLRLAIGGAVAGLVGVGAVFWQFLKSCDNAPPAISAFEAHYKWMKMTVSALAILTVCVAADEQSQDCIRPFRGGGHHLGIYTGATALPSNAAGRLFSLLESRDDEKCIVPLDVEFLSTGIHQDALFWQISFNTYQAEHCTALIIATTAEPSFLALIPIDYLAMVREVSSSSTYTVKIKKMEIASMVNLAPFPPKWSPLILPYSKLGEALDSLRAYAIGTADQRRDPTCK